MKSIKLTEEHKTKLLEMCKVLFPKYTFIDWNLLGELTWDKGYLKYYTDKMKYAKFIHWFEFCITHLIKKLHKTDNSYIDVVNGETGYLDGSFYEGLICYMLSKKHYKHPIDYLYEQFKTLKQ